MACAQRLVDDLRNIGLVLFEALEQVRKNRDEFVVNADAEQVRQFESSVTRVRFFAERLESELGYLEYLIAEPGT